VAALGLQLEQLARIVPFVGSLREVESLVALEPYELGIESLGEHAREHRLTDAGRAFEEQRPLEAQREVHAHRERVVDDVTVLGETLAHGLVTGHREAAPYAHPIALWGT